MPSPPATSIARIDILHKHVVQVPASDGNQPRPEMGKKIAGKEIAGKGMEGRGNLQISRRDKETPDKQRGEPRREFQPTGVLVRASKRVISSFNWLIRFLSEHSVTAWRSQHSKRGQE